MQANTGNLVWSRNVAKDYEAQGGIGFGYSCSPILTDNMLILPVGGTGASIVALDPKTGDEIWKAGNQPASYSPAFPIQFEEQSLVVGYLQNALVIHDCTTGTVVGQLDLSVGYDEHSAWPLYDEPYLWLSGPFRGGSQLLELSLIDGKFSLLPVWQSRNMSNDVMSSVLVDGHLYGFDLFEPQAKTHRASRGKFRCINFKTGEISWSNGSGRHRRKQNESDQSEPEIGQSGIVAADGKLLLLNELGELVLLKANRQRYEELAMLYAK